MWGILLVVGSLIPASLEIALSHGQLLFQGWSNGHLLTQLLSLLEELQACQVSS